MYSAVPKPNYYGTTECSCVLIATRVFNVMTCTVHALYFIALGREYSSLHAFCNSPLYVPVYIAQ